MHPKSTTSVDEIRAYFDSDDTYGHAQLVLERLPNDTYLWLKPEDDAPRYVLTDRGRADLRRAEAEAGCLPDDLDARANSGPWWPRWRGRASPAPDGSARLARVRASRG